MIGAARPVELVDDGGDERRTVPDLAEQVATAPGLHRLEVAGAEGVPDLVVEVGAVGDDDDARVGDVGRQRERASQHDHGERLAGALGVPDDASLPAAVEVAVPDAVERAVDREVLLMARDLADAGVENREEADEAQEAARAAERVDGAVLLRDGAGLGRCVGGDERWGAGVRGVGRWGAGIRGGEVWRLGGGEIGQGASVRGEERWGAGDGEVWRAGGGEIARVDGFGFGGDEGAVGEPVEGAVVGAGFGGPQPSLPELGRSSHRGVAGLGVVHRHEQPREVEEVRDVVPALVTRSAGSRPLPRPWWDACSR